MRNVAFIGVDVNGHASEYEPSHEGPAVRRVRKPAAWTVEQCKAKAAQIVATALATAGLTRQSAADAAGVSRSMVDRWMGADMPRTMPIGRLLVMGSSSARGRDAARLILTSALAYLDGPDPIESCRTLRDRIDDLHAEVGDVASVWRAAMVDGCVSASEARNLMREVHEVELACAKIRHEAAKLASGEESNVR
jgi:hypothetical protein